MGAGGQGPGPRGPGTGDRGPGTGGLAERTQFAATPNEANFGGTPNEAKLGKARDRRICPRGVKATPWDRFVCPWGGSLGVWVCRGADFDAEADGLRCVFSVSFLRFSNYFETAGASRPAPTGLWNRFQSVQRFLARKKVETEQRLATRQGASLYSDFKITGGERTGRERMCGSC
jgi:hypothetical protein